MRDAEGDGRAGRRAPAAPRSTPSKIVAIGLNYKDHAAEQGKAVPAEPLMFLKPPSAVIGPGATIEVPAWAGRVDHEAEMGLVIGTTARDVADAAAGRAHILGAVCVNDVTARELQNKDVQFTRAKGFDTFCPVGPCLATGLDYGNLRGGGPGERRGPPAEHDRAAHLRRRPPGVGGVPRDDALPRRYHLHGHPGRHRPPHARRRGGGRGGGDRGPRNPVGTRARAEER